MPEIVEVSEIHRCARDGTKESFERLKVLVEGDPTLVNARNYIGHTPLHNATFNGHRAIVDFLINHGTDLTIESTGGTRVLSCACEGSWGEIANKFLAHGTEVNHENNAKVTALHFAVRAGNQCIVKVLLMHGAKVDIKSMYWGTPLAMALERGFTGIAELLREAGAEE